MAKIRETVRGMTEGQRSDIIATMVGAIPGLNFDEAQGIIGNKGPFVTDINAVFKRHTGKPVPAANTSTELNIGGRVYELVPFLKEGECSVSGDTMVERANELGANLGEEDGTFILKHQDEIPQELRRKIYMVFTGWRNPSDPQHVAYLDWYGRRWGRSGDWLDNLWLGGYRLVRRRT